MIKEDIAQGLEPKIVFATAGTTDNGIIDPINKIADIAQKYGLYFHLDGAYGGFFAILEENKEYYEGLDRVDSMTLDPHKSFFTPNGTGMFLVKDIQNMKSALSFTRPAYY